jgi:glyoxylase-like metal-dependent hydrolase (beta-lactamase superfamily II)
MIEVATITFNDFQVNTYLVWDETGQCLVVDPSFYSTSEQEAFESELTGKGLRLTGQINTHCHVDHMLGVGYIRSRYGFPFRAHRDEAKIVASTTLMGDLFGWKVEPLEGIDLFLEDSEMVPVGNHSLQGIHVPGHSMGSMAFYSREGGFVITGDALFRSSIGRTDLPGGNYDTLIASIRNRLLVLPPGTVAFPGHGPSTTIGEELHENPYLKVTA